MKTIGVFDSGLGGLTVVRSLEHIKQPITVKYIGDTLHLPYGTKSPRAINQLSQNLAHCLNNMNIDLLVVACNSASAISLPALKETFSIPIVGVIDPVAKESMLKTKSKTIGVIGTNATITSNSYKKLLNENGFSCIQKACPLFVPLVEEGWTETPAAKWTIEQYLSTFKNKPIDTLILGCTHYPLLTNSINNFFEKKILLLDSAEACAKKVADLLNLDFSCNTREPNNLELYVTDRLKHFERLAGIFLGHPIKSIEEISITNF